RTNWPSVGGASASARRSTKPSTTISAGSRCNPTPGSYTRTSRPPRTNSTGGTTDMGLFDSVIQQQVQAGTRAPQNLDAELILSTAPQQWRVMVNDIATLVQNKYETLISKGAVYTGRMVDGQ